MTVFLSTGSFTREIGPKRLLDAFFDTVGCRLEPEGRATRFPAIMGDLFAGVLMAKRAAAALAELGEIEQGLRALPAAKVPGAEGRKGGNAYEFLTSPDGRPLVEHLRAAVQESLRSGKCVRVSSVPGDRVKMQLAVVVALIGVAWILAVRRFFGHWILISIHQHAEDHSGLYVWTFGFLFVAIGLAQMVATAFPPLRVWFERRKWATLVLALGLVGALIYFGQSPR